MSAWIIWISVGVLCLIIEIFTPGFLFMSFGIASIITGIAATLISNVPVQMIIFAIVTFITFINMKKISKKLLSGDTEKTNINALIGKMGKVTKDILPFERGYAKIEGEIWSAISKENVEIKADEKIVVHGVAGNKLIVKKVKGE